MNKQQILKWIVDWYDESAGECPAWVRRLTDGDPELQRWRREQCTLGAQLQSTAPQWRTAVTDVSTSRQDTGGEGRNEVTLREKSLDPISGESPRVSRAFWALAASVAVATFLGWQAVRWRQMSRSAKQVESIAAQAIETGSGGWGHAVKTFDRLRPFERVAMSSSDLLPTFSEDDVRQWTARPLVNATRAYGVALGTLDRELWSGCQRIAVDLHTVLSFRRSETM